MAKNTSAGSASAGLPAVTLDDLRTGRRPRITEAECAQITGRGKFSLQRDRWKGIGLPFQKDENGRVFYLSEDVLAYFDRCKKHRATCEYDTSVNVARLEKAREVLAENRQRA